MVKASMMQRRRGRESQSPGGSAARILDGVSVPQASTASDYVLPCSALVHPSNTCTSLYPVVFYVRTVSLFIIPRIFFFFKKQ